MAKFKTYTYLKTKIFERLITKFHAFIVHEVATTDL